MPEGEEDREEEEEEEEIPQKPQSNSKPQPKQPQQSEEEEEEESEEEEEEEEESEDEDEQQGQNKKTQKETQAPKKDPQPEPESETESDSQKASDFTIKPIKSVEEKPETPVSKPAAKRRAENGGKGSKPKKSKTSTEASAEEEEEGGGVATPAEKKSSINRLWSEEDEIAMLKGLIEFQANMKKDPSAHQQEFHEFVKKSLHVDVSKSQVMDKIRRLKNKFKTNMKKSTNGEDPVFSKPHEYKAFQLSKKIWGGQNGVDDAANTVNSQEKSSTREKPSVDGKSSSGRNSRKSSNDKLALVDVNANSNANANTGTTKEEDPVVRMSVKTELNQGKDDEELGKLYPFLMGSFRRDYISDMPIPELVKSNLSLVGSSELKELDRKWKEQNAAEMEVFLGRIDLVREETRMVLDAMKSSKN